MKIEIKESAGARIGLNEDVSSFGLDSDLYLAVIEAELGRGGVVNLNNRVYRNSEFVRENATLGERVKAQFVEGEAGHPSTGPTFDVPVRLVAVEVEERDNESMATGKFAILNTQVGRDILTLHKAELPLGVSSRGYGVVEAHVIDEDSPYARANPGRIGDTVMEVTEFDLLTYDLVRVPSAGTHVKPATQSNETREAFIRVCESGLLGMSHLLKETNVSKKEEVVTPAVHDEQKELAVVTEEKAEEKVEETVVAVEAPLSSLTEGQQAVLLKLASVIEGASEAEEVDAELVEQVKRVADQADVDRQRLTEAEEANRALTEKVAALEAERREEQKQNDIREAIESALEGKPNSDLVKKEIVALVSEGRLDDPEAITVWCNRLVGMVESVVAHHAAAVGSAVVEAVDASDDLVDVSETKDSGAEAPGLLNEDFVAQLRGIIERDRTLQGRA